MLNLHFFNETFTYGFNYDFSIYSFFYSLLLIIILLLGIALYMDNRMSIDYITRKVIDENTDPSEWKRLELTLRRIINTQYPLVRTVRVNQVIPFLSPREISLLHKYYYHQTNKYGFPVFSLISPRKGDRVLVDIGLSI
jgi:energy-converting hydrogenase Eha subunit F